MNFWIFTIALLLIPAAVISWPLLAGTVRERLSGLILLLLIPMAGIILYQQVGSPQAINQPAEHKPSAQQQENSSQQVQLDDLVTQLQQRMNENPGDPEGWLMLGRSLKTMRRYAEAKTALNNADRLMPGDPLIMVELAEATLFASGQGEITGEIQQLLASALEIDPMQQKALWLMGMAVSQAGDDAQAVAIWQKLLGQLDPESGAAQTVGEQIAQARQRAGMTVEQTPIGIVFPVNISIAEELSGALPGTAVLFVFMRPAGTSGMPLAAKRIPAPEFPLSLSFSDADLLRPGTSFEGLEQLTVSARISMSGVANIASGDFVAEEITINTDAIPEISLLIDQGVP